MVNFGIVGCGHIGKRHSEMVFRNPSCHLSALCDIKPYETLGIEKYQSAAFYRDYETMLQSHPEINVVNICVPNGLHARFSIMAMEHGFHTVIEKPMALNTTDAQSIIDCSLKTGKKVFCVMQNRYSPPSVWIKELVESGRLGKIYMVGLNCFWNRDLRYYTPDSWHGSSDMDGGTLFTQFSHFIDIMLWLFGEVSDIKGVFNDFNHHNLTAFEDSGMIQFRLKEGGMGYMNYSTSVFDANLESSLTIIAENGSVKIGGQYMDKVEICHVKDYVMPELPATNPGNDYGAYKGSAQNHHYVIQEVVNVLSGTGKISTTMYEGYQTVKMIEDCYKARGGRW